MLPVLGALNYTLVPYNDLYCLGNSLNMCSISVYLGKAYKINTYINFKVYANGQHVGHIQLQDAQETLATRNYLGFRKGRMCHKTR